MLDFVAGRAAAFCLANTGHPQSRMLGEPGRHSGRQGLQQDPLASVARLHSTASQGPRCSSQVQDPFLPGV